MKQRYCIETVGTIIYKVETITNNGGKIVCITEIGNNYLLIYTDK